MTTPSQLGTLRGKIDELEAEILDIKKALAAAQTPADIAFLRADIAFLRQRLGDLDKKEILLLEQQNRLQGPAPGEHRLPCYLLPMSCCSSIHTFKMS